MSEWVIGVLGGSGLYAIDALEDAEWVTVDTPWGQPSDQLLTGWICGIRFVFLPRHGRGHRLPPPAVNARANIDALKRAGCTDLLSVSAVGSLREELDPGRFVIVDQFIDRTNSRDSSFFGPGLVAHVSMADPVCPRLSAFASAAAEAAGADGDEAHVWHRSQIESANLMLRLQCRGDCSAHVACSAVTKMRIGSLHTKGDNKPEVPISARAAFLRHHCPRVEINNYKSAVIKLTSGYWAASSVSKTRLLRLPRTKRRATRSPK